MQAASRCSVTALSSLFHLPLRSRFMPMNRRMKSIMRRSLQMPFGNRYHSSMKQPNLFLINGNKMPLGVRRQPDMSSSRARLFGGSRSGEDEISDEDAFNSAEVSKPTEDTPIDKLFWNTIRASRWESDRPVLEENVARLRNLYPTLPINEKLIFIDHLFHCDPTYPSEKSTDLPESKSELDHEAVNNGNSRETFYPLFPSFLSQVVLQKGGLKFLMDLRKDVINFTKEARKENKPTIKLEKADQILLRKLNLWLSEDLLKLERITWKSSYEMLQKVLEYDWVLPMKNWMNIKVRLGPYRRCFALLHHCLPGEPLTVLHTFLSNDISSNIREIIPHLETSDAGTRATKQEWAKKTVEDAEKVNAAVFYSVSSTQRGLLGTSVGSRTITMAIKQLENEFPRIEKFSSLSPIPHFVSWLSQKLKSCGNDHEDLLTLDEVASLAGMLNTNDVFGNLPQILSKGYWTENEELFKFLERPLMRLCARYLYLEKNATGYAADRVANFHLRNGAVMWRLNWNANPLPMARESSCGIMVNYRYFLEETANRKTEYQLKRMIAASEQVLQLVDEARRLMSRSKL